MKDIKFINSFSFIFSPRPGTPAANLQEVDFKIAKDRLLRFQEISNKIKKTYRDSLTNSIVNVLFENKVKNKNQYFGRDEYYNSVIVESNVDLTGKIKNVKIDRCNHNTLFGDIVIEQSQKDNAA